MPISTDRTKSFSSQSDFSLEKPKGASCYTWNYYAVTIKQRGNTKYTTSDLLDKKLAFQIKWYNGSIHTVKYELDTENRLHLHALVSLKGVVKPYPQRGWTIDIQCLRTQDDKFRWEDYIQKCAWNSYEQDQILFLNEARNHNLFPSVAV